MHDSQLPLPNHAGRAHTAVVDARLLSRLRLTMSVLIIPLLRTLLWLTALRHAGFQCCHRSPSYHQCVSLRHAHRRSLRTIRSRLSGAPATLWPVLERYLRLPVSHLTSFLAQAVSVRGVLLSICTGALLARQRALASSKSFWSCPTVHSCTHE